MIRFDRGDEPPELKAVREEKLPKLRKAIEDGEVLESNDPRLGGYGPPAVREKLYEAQHHKCCYCEKEIEDKYEDLDHFRGRTKVNRGPGSTATHGYWWLAHRWDNLLYACPQCNKAPNKGTKFPLAIGSTALVAEEEPPGRERPLLILAGATVHGLTRKRWRCMRARPVCGLAAGHTRAEPPSSDDRTEATCSPHTKPPKAPRPPRSMPARSRSSPKMGFCSARGSSSRAAPRSAPW